MRYRSDIDGLRALAVASIILFHLSSRLLPNGFLGVDIFFVISGFLITRIIVGEMDAGDFSLLHFYRRRVVRILPALLVMIVAVCLAGWALLLPTQLRALGHSAAAAAGFSSNFYFWGHTAYFGTPNVQPLLHTWSLAVEEQFYLLYPPFLLALRRWLPGQLRLMLGLATLGSAALAWWLAIDHPTGAFFLLPTRGWELGLGGLVALGCFPPLAQPRAREWASAAGLALVLGSLAWLPADMAVPAPAAIPACLGTALLIAYGAEAMTARLLSLPPLRWLGLISYSLYLWHWPLISFYRGEVEGMLSTTALLGLTAAMLAAAVLSYRFIERPMRERFRTGGRPLVIVAAGIAASLAVVAAASGLAAGADRLRPLPPEAARVGAYFEYQNTPLFDYQFGPVACHSGTMRYDMANCLRFSASKRNVVVLGDSHAAHLWRALAERFPNDNVLEAASTRCLPLIGAGGGRLCREMFADVMRRIQRPGQVQGVVLSGSWTGGSLALLPATIRAIRAGGATVTVIGPSVSYRRNLPELLAKAIWRNDYAAVERARNPRVAMLDRRMRAVVEAEGATYYSLYDQECPAGKCRLLTRGGVPLHFDEAHFTLDGAREMVAGLPAI
jgi:peptidoglycan/LPS O-acetylase OafA/YrhL